MAFTCEQTRYIHSHDLTNILISRYISISYDIEKYHDNIWPYRSALAVSLSAGGVWRSSTNNALRSVWPKWFVLDTRTICLLRRCEGERESSDERGKTKRKHASRERDVCACCAELQFAQRSMREPCFWQSRGPFTVLDQAAGPVTHRKPILGALKLGLHIESCLQVTSNKQRRRTALQNPTKDETQRLPSELTLTRHKHHHHKQKFTKFSEESHAF